MKLEDLQATAGVRGILSDALVTVVSARWFGADALELTCRGAGGELGSEILYRDDEARLEMVEQGRPWSFDGDGELFRLVSEALRIHLAHLFDPTLAVHTSLVEPLPHQITAVSEALLPRQPLRFLLADDPGAGKTIMTGLLMKELIARGDLQRCLVVCPGSLAEQWQDELYQRFHLNFEIFTNDKADAARTGNWFLESKAQEHAVNPCRVGASTGDPLGPAQPARQDRGRGQGSADQGDRLLGPPRLPAPRPGTGRQPLRQAQLRRGAPTRGYAAGPPPAAVARTPARSSACAAASRWCSAARSWFRKVCSRPSAESARLHPTTCATPRSPPPGRVPSSWTPSAPSASSPPTGRRSISGTTSRAAGRLLIY